MSKETRVFAQGIAQYVTTHKKYESMTDMEKMEEAIAVALTDPTAAGEALSVIIKERGIKEVMRKLIARLPEPETVRPRRNGGILECGCWSHLMPGTMAKRDYYTCPTHGRQLIIATNVLEPERL